MALKGLFVTTWIGWLTGVLLLRYPWGVPSFHSWISFSTLYALIFLTMHGVLTADFYQNGSNEVYMGETHAFGKWVKAFVVVQFTTITLLKRFSLFANAKKLGRLMEILNKYDETNKPKRKKNRCSVTFEDIVVYSAYVLTFISFGIGVRDFFIRNSKRASWFGVLGPFGFTILFVMFAIVPLSTVTNCTFAIVLVLSRRVSEVVTDFCNQVGDSLPFLVENDYGSKAAETSRNGEFYEVFQLDWKSRFCEKARKRGNGGISPAGKEVPKIPFLTRQDVIDRFEEIMDLIKLANDALSASTLWLVCGMTLGLVGNASLFVVVRHQGIALANDILLSVLVFIYSFLLQVGHRIGEMQKSAKWNMYQKFTALAGTPEKAELEDVIQSIMECEWKLSASGFFTVDRRLASGIFSLVLNYVVIFVQLNIALTETPPPLCMNGTDSNSTHFPPIK